MASNIEVQSLFGQFKEAYSRLKEAINIKEESDINPVRDKTLQVSDGRQGRPISNGVKRDAVIKRFEFSYELLWKTYKKIARLQKLDCFNPKACFQFAFKSGLIENEELFLEIIDARNKTTHVYSEEEAKSIYNFIKEKVIDAFDMAEEKIDRASHLSASA